MVNDPKISVIIPTLRRPLQMRDLLGSLERQICNAPFEVIVVSNLPERGLKKTVESFGKSFRYFETGRLGVNIARNKGLEKARAPIALFLDDDCYVQSRSFLQRHLDLHEEHPDVVGIGGRYSMKHGASRRERAFHWKLDHELSQARLDDGYAIRLAGGNCSFKLRLLGRHMSFNEKVVLGESEADLCAQLVRHGYKLMQFEKLEVEHRLSLNLWDFTRRAYLRGYSHGHRQASPMKTTIRHWNSMLTLEQSLQRRGVPQDPALTPHFAHYDRMFEFGAKLGARSVVTAPPLSFRQFAFDRLHAVVVRGAMKMVHRFFLLVDRSLSLP